MYEELYTFISSTPVVEKNVGYSESRQKTYYVETGQVDGLYCGIKCSTTGPQDAISVLFKAPKNKKFILDQIKERCEDLTLNGEGAGNDPWVSYAVSDLDAAVELWTDFVQ